jgi:peroxiredoxin
MEETVKVSLRPLAAAWAVAAVCACVTPTHASTTDSPAAPTPALRAGDRAPDFSYRSHDYRWLALGDLLEQADLLLVFGADDAALSRLEEERAALLQSGVLPIAVLDLKDDKVWNTVNRLQLGFSVMSDPKHTVASLYGAYDRATGRTGHAWYVVDRNGRVRASGKDAPPSTGAWSSLAADALRRPAPGEARSASAH